MSIGQDKSVSVEPLVILWVVQHLVFVQGDTNSCHAHGGSGMTTVEILNDISDVTSERFQNEIMDQIVLFDRSNWRNSHSSVMQSFHSSQPRGITSFYIKIWGNFLE